MAIGMTEIELIQSFKQISFLTIPVNESTVPETLLNFSQTVILFLSGKDDQIKYLGYRIELGEIGSVLQLLDCVNDAAAIALAMEEHSVPEIVAFVELNGAADLNTIREFLEKRLPDYMVPKKTEKLHRIPRTENGKVDRHYLKKIYFVSQQQQKTKALNSS